MFWQARASKLHGLFEEDILKAVPEDRARGFYQDKPLSAFF